MMEPRDTEPGTMNPHDPASRVMERRSWMRWVAGVFGALQIAGLAMILSSRGGVTLEKLLPRPVHSMIIAWHLLVLLPWLAFAGVITLAVLAALRWARRRRAPAPGANVPGPTAPSEVVPPAL